jgi:N-acetylmuramoyl-L-alanine amidase
MKIAIHAGHAKDGNKYCGAVALLKESTENRKVKDEVVRLLKLAGHTVVDCTVDERTSAGDIINKIVSKTNASNADLGISIHFNAGANDKAGNGSSCGFEVLATEFSGIKKEISSRMCSNASKLGFRNRGMKVRDNLGFLNKTKMKALLVECCFIDDADDVKLYNYKTMAKAIAEAIHGSSIEEKNDTSVETNNEVIFRVIAGSFKSRTNAEVQVEKLKALGISAFLEAKKEA